MCFNIEYSCHTIANIIHCWRLSLQLMTNRSLTCNYSNACLCHHDVIIELLTLLFNNSLNQGMVPQEWKKALVTPIQKKGNKKLASNYRPVSLASITCKMMEKIMYSFIIDHIYANNYFSNFQHGFMKGRSTTSQLLDGRKVGHFLITIQKSFKLIIN